MAINFNIVKCPQCGSTNRAVISNNFFHCNQCGSNYYGRDDANDGLIVSSGKSFVAHSAASATPRKSNAKSFVIIGIVVLCAVAGYHLLTTAFQDEREEDSFMTNTLPTVQPIESDNRTPDVIYQPTETKSYPRTAFVLYSDPESKQVYLFKADFLTQNKEQDDEKAVLIKKEDGKFVGYDASNNKIIPNFKQLIETPLSLETAILYVDKENIIIKNKISTGYQLEMVNPYNGDIVWTLSEKELPELSKLTGKYSAETNEGIELFRGNFRIKLAPNYYVVDKKGEVIGFGKLN